ncbi:MAG: hypothetical protein JXA24_00570 [Proteobacteria bacterium]|nr:hypothetical protein [Pseudomonadota bacterium]
MSDIGIEQGGAQGDISAGRVHFSSGSGHGDTCPPNLAGEASVGYDPTVVPDGTRTRIFTSTAEYSFYLVGSRDDGRRYGCFGRWVGCYFAAGMAPRKVPASKRESYPVPVVSGVGFKYGRAPNGLNRATHMEVKVLPDTDAYLIWEIYDADGPGVSVLKSKDRKNKWLPRSDVDLFKSRVPVAASRAWQTLYLSLARFVDWNRKRSGCESEVRGVNEDVGDGVLNLDEGDSFQVQALLEAKGYDESASAYIYPHVKFVRYE